MGCLDIRFLHSLKVWQSAPHHTHFRSLINFILFCDINILLTTSQSGSLVLVVFVAGVLPGLEPVFLLSFFRSLRWLWLGLRAGWVVGWHAGLGVVEIYSCFSTASYDSTFLTRSLNVQESSIWGTRVVFMWSCRWVRNFLCFTSSEMYWFPFLSISLIRSSYTGSHLAKVLIPMCRPSLWGKAVSHSFYRRSLLVEGIRNSHSTNMKLKKDALSISLMRW